MFLQKKKNVRACSLIVNEYEQITHFFDLIIKLWTIMHKKYTYQDAATCDISGLSIGYGYCPGLNGYIGGRVRPKKLTNKKENKLIIETM